MKKSMKSFKSALIVGILLVSTILVVSPSASAQDEEDQGREKLLSFNSYIILDCDASQLSEPIGIETPTFVPLNIEYKHDLPPLLFKLIPFNFLRNFIFFGNIVQPLMHFSLDFEPIDNISVYFLQSDMFASIPAPLESVNFSNGLVISPHADASPGPHSLEFTICSDSIGRLKSAERSHVLTFSVE